MFVTSSGGVVFQNFSKHLAVHHEEYLYEADRSFSMQSTQPTVGQYFSTQQVDTEFWGGVERQQDIDVFSFYQAVASTIPSILVVIRKILSDMSATATNERVFNVAGNVLNIRRCRLAPARAEKLILSAFRFRCNARASKAPPFLPSFGIIDVRDNPDDAIDEQVEQERLDDDAAAWEAFFEE